MDSYYHGSVLSCLTGLSVLWLRASLPTGSVLSVVYAGFALSTYSLPTIC